MGDDIDAEAKSASQETPKIEQALERIKIWQEALQYYDQRRLLVLTYAIALNAALISLPKLGLDDQTVPSGTHRWYVGLTVTPTSIGLKTNLGFYFETEFL